MLAKHTSMKAVLYVKKLHFCVCLIVFKLKE